MSLHILRTGTLFSGLKVHVEMLGLLRFRGSIYFVPTSQSQSVTFPRIFKTKTGTGRYNMILYSTVLNNQQYLSRVLLYSVYTVYTEEANNIPPCNYGKLALAGVAVRRNYNFFVSVGQPSALHTPLNGPGTVFLGWFRLVQALAPTVGWIKKLDQQ